MTGERRLAGRVTRPHGVRGDLLVEVHTDSPERRFADGAVLEAQLAGGARRLLTVAASRAHSGRLLVSFVEVAGRDEAEALRGALLTVAAEDTPPADPDEFYDHQLEGLAVELSDGSRVGVVDEVVHGPGGELLVVRRPDGGQALVPFVRAIVPTVDLVAGRIVLTPPEGLLG